MDAFIFQGSKGGAGRSASSVILATGLAALGYRPLHLQVTLSRIPPIVATARNLPFSAAWIPEEQATIEAVEAVISAHSSCSMVVVDMTRRPAWELALTYRRLVILLPMRRTDAEIATAVRDYWAIAEFQNSVRTGSIGSSSIPALRILPITWPIGTTTRDLSQRLSLPDAPILGTSKPPQILMPGIPALPPDDLADLINGTRYECSIAIRDAAVNISRTATDLLKSSAP